MSRHHVLAIVLIVAAAALATAIAGGFTSSTPRSVSGAPEGSAFVVTAPAPRAVARPRMAWRPGERLVFALDWRSSNAVKLGSSRAMSLDVEIVGQLSIAVLPPRDDRRFLSLRFEKLARARISLDGRALYADDHAAAQDLLGKRAVVELTADGAMRRVALDADPSGLFRHVMRAALVELEIIVPSDADAGDAEWSAEELGPSGLARVDYRVTGEGALVRRRGAYDSIGIAPPRVGGGESVPREQKLDSVAIIRTDGSLTSLVDDESLAVVDDGVTVATTSARFALERIGIEVAEPESEPLASAWQDFGEGRASDGLARRMLAQRVDGLTAARMRTDVMLYAGSGLIAEQSRWVWRATGLLVARPETSDALAKLFESAALDTAARGLVLDLLASAGHARAQAAMRRALSSKTLDDDAAVDLVQRVSFLLAPEDATIDLLVAKNEDAQARQKDALASATLYTLGACLGNMRARHAADPHPRAHALLLSRLAASSTGGMRRAALAALGNAGFPADGAAIRAHAGDDDELVRSQVAWSLRKVDSQESRTTLLTLAGDSTSAVQTSALRVLAQLALGEDDLARMESLAKSPRLTTAAALPLVDLLGAYVPTPKGHAALETLRARDDLDSSARSRARALLAPNASDTQHTTEQR